ncbi:MAG: hypothetical protein JWN28_96 [Candidatus Saccharibacteria bacterium]|nr:hypothetical protein [Candidatus Saccharibacteria bacterium]
MSEYVFSDKEYGDVIDNFVIGCVDVAICYDGKILLERRERNPIKSEWWIFGGRMLRDETFTEAARRGVHRELGLNLPVERFSEIGAYNLIWPVRREVEKSNGCHHLLVAHHVGLNKQEYEEVNKHIVTESIIAEWFEYKNVSDNNFLKEIKDIAYKSSLIAI